VPWFVEWVKDDHGQLVGVPIGEGVPRFEIMSHDRWVLAIKESRCWVCGGRLSAWRAFAIGPMCAVNHTSAEPPSHVDCAEWSARNCPFLSRPRMSRRAHIPEGAKEAPGVALMRNPGVALVWVTKAGRYKLTRVPNGQLFDIGDPLRVSWWCEGREATRAEIEESIDSGLPSLLGLAEDEGPRAVRQLHRQVDRARELLPV
jgi:hypothetical protein